MNRPAYIFVLLVSAAAVGLLATLIPYVALADLDGRDAIGLFFFVAVALLAEALAIDFGSGKQARSSLAFLPILSCATLFSPAISVLVVLCVITCSNFVLRRQQFAKGLFNVSQVVLAVGIGGVLYSGLARLTSTANISLVGFAALACAFFVTNIMLTGIALALIREQPISVVLPQVIGPRGSNLWYDLLASPIAVVGAMLYQSHYVTGILIILLPLLLIRYSYLSKLQLEEANRDLLKVLVKAIETRDPYTSGHSLRVATLARAIAEDLSLSRRKVEQIETAALLHDIGKIDSVYATVILKPYDLNAEERSLIRTHATKGADLLESLSSVSRDVIRAVRHHHERYDGTGYPDGLRGTSIPLAARIIMLCDSIDAMLSDRPYRSALSLPKVHAELARCSSTQFDPHLVTVVLARNTLQRAAALAQRSADVERFTPALASSA
jgi:putative nucleotidyltransferase with HDIG domain